MTTQVLGGEFFTTQNLLCFTKEEWTPISNTPYSNENKHLVEFGQDNYEFRIRIFDFQ